MCSRIPGSGRENEFHAKDSLIASKNVWMKQIHMGAKETTILQLSHSYRKNVA